MKRLISLSILTLAAGLFAAGAAEAANTSATFGVTANAVGACTVSAVPMDFGTIVGASTLTATGGITVNCTTGTTYALSMNTGTYGAGSFWYMRNGTNQLGYQLYKMADFTSSYAGSPTAGTGTGADQAYGVYGRMMVSGSPVLGAYSDTVSVTVTY